MFRRYLAVAALAMLAVVGGETGARAQLVISQVYPGGGSGQAGTAYRQDYIVVANNSSSAVSLSGFSLQYASATGAFNAVYSFSAAATVPAFGQYTVVTGTAGAAGAVNPVYSAGDGANDGLLNLGAAGGKVALVNNTTALGAVTTGNINGTNANILDFVGYGTATAFEGTAAAQAPGSNANSIYRALGVTAPIYIDTNNNSADFTPAAASQPAPVPEPATVLAAGSAALAGVGALRRRRRKQPAT